MRPEVLVLSRASFNEFVRDTDHSNFVAVRISNPYGEGHSDDTNFFDELCIDFWDVEDISERYVPISQHQARTIVDFLVKYKDRKQFVFHCEAGLKRSFTCALFLADKILGDDVLVGLLSSDQKRALNFRVWGALYDTYREGKYGA